MPKIHEIVHTNVSFQINCANGKTLTFEHKPLRQMNKILATFARKHWGRNLRHLGTLPENYQDSEVIDTFFEYSPNSYEVI